MNILFKNWTGISPVDLDYLLCFDQAGKEYEGSLVQFKLVPEEDLDLPGAYILLREIKQNQTSFQKEMVRLKAVCIEETKVWLEDSSIIQVL